MTQQESCERDCVAEDEKEPSSAGVQDAEPAEDPGERSEHLELRGAEVLAPMVRASTLPLRLESLRYGADLVYGEEIIDRKLIGAVRMNNEAFNLINFVSPREKGVVFSTCAEERRRVIFQMGTANAAFAVQAALLVCNDVRGVDVNMGCPKSFSVKGGMGAALLDKPEVAADILSSLRRNLPSTCSVTCKIRMLPTTARTRDFMQVCERSGAEAIAVHMRSRDERPADPAHWDQIVKLWDAVRVPVLANGDFFHRRQIDAFWKHCAENGCRSTAGPLSATGVDQADEWRGPAGIMIARGAMWNPSIFCRSGEAPCFEEVVRRYTATAVTCNEPYQNTKYVLASMLSGGTGVPVPTSFDGTVTKKLNQVLSTSKSMSTICQSLGVPYGGGYPAKAHTPGFYKDFDFSACPVAIAQASRAQKREAPDTTQAREKRAKVQENPVIEGV